MSKVDNCSAEINRNNLLQDSARMFHSVSIYLSAHERSVTLLSTLNFLPWKPMTNYPPSSLLTYRFFLSPWSKIFDFRDFFISLWMSWGGIWFRFVAAGAYLSRNYVAWWLQWRRHEPCVTLQSLREFRQRNLSYFSGQHQGIILFTISFTLSSLCAIFDG